MLLWHVVHQADQAVTFGDVAISFRQSHYAEFDINPDNVTEIIKALSQEIQYG